MIILSFSFNHYKRKQKKFLKVKNQQEHNNKQFKVREKEMYENTLLKKKMYHYEDFRYNLDKNNHRS